MKGTFEKHRCHKKLVRNLGRYVVKEKINARLKLKYNFKTHYKILNDFPSMDI
jgi:hypothetical protein